MDFDRIREIEQRIAERQDDLSCSESLTEQEKQDLEDQINDLHDEMNEVLED